MTMLPPLSKEYTDEWTRPFRPNPPPYKMIVEDKIRSSYMEKLNNLIMEACAKRQVLARHKRLKRLQKSNGRSLYQIFNKVSITELPETPRLSPPSPEPPPGTTQLNVKEANKPP